MAHLANVSHGVDVTKLIRRVAGTFKVNHNLFPTFGVDWYHSNLFLLLGLAPKTNTCNAFEAPCFDIFRHLRPPC